MTAKRIALALAAILLVSGCGLFGSGAPGKSDVQKALENSAQQNPLLFGSAKPVVKDTKCAKVSDDIYNCTTSLAMSDDPEAHTVTVKMTKLNGKWEAQINILGGLLGQ